MNNGQNNTRNRNALLEDIGEISFVLDDLRLYLDTHDNCSAAGEMFYTLSGARKKLIEEYTESYGPLEAYAPYDGEWLWNNTKMPWEGEC
ncbi:MAG: spore coat protein CotJB [Ruminococcaceae bacterium]|nr:spore coat protein CotJB [Oscillospiraceae bacterium]